MTYQFKSVKYLRDDWENKIKTENVGEDDSVPRRKGTSETRRMTFHFASEEYNEDAKDNLLKELGQCFKAPLKPRSSCPLPIRTKPAESILRGSRDISADIEEVYDEDIGFVRVQYLHSGSPTNQLSKEEKVNERHLIKHSFVVELHEEVRNLCHLFLFNDVLLCAKYKSSGVEEQFIFQLKWFIPLDEVTFFYCNG